MKMLSLSVAACLIAAAAGGCANQSATKADPMAMMSKMQELGTPGPQHAMLNRLVGSWNAESKYWMEPGAQPETSRGTMTMRSIMDGHYLQGDYRGSYQMPGPDGKMMEKHFTGLMLWGYSNADKEYQSVWLDSDSTAIFDSEGRAGSDSRVIEMTGDGMGPDMAGNVVEQKMWLKTTITSDDRFVQEFWGECGGRPKFKTMEIVYTRSGR